MPTSSTPTLTSEQLKILQQHEERRCFHAFRSFCEHLVRGLKAAPITRTTKAGSSQTLQLQLVLPPLTSEHSDHDAMLAENAETFQPTAQLRYRWSDDDAWDTLDSLQAWSDNVAHPWTYLEGLLDTLESQLLATSGADRAALETTFRFVESWTQPSMHQALLTPMPPSVYRTSRPLRPVPGAVVTHPLGEQLADVHCFLLCPMSLIQALSPDEAKSFWTRFGQRVTGHTTPVSNPGGAEESEPWNRAVFNALLPSYQATFRAEAWTLLQRCSAHDLGPLPTPEAFTPDEAQARLRDAPTPVPAHATEPSVDDLEAIRAAQEAPFWDARTPVPAHATEPSVDDLEAIRAAQEAPWGPQEAGGGTFLQGDRGTAMSTVAREGDQRHPRRSAGNGSERPQQRLHAHPRRGGLRRRVAQAMTPIVPTAAIVELFLALAIIPAMLLALLRHFGLVVFNLHKMRTLRRQRAHARSHHERTRLVKQLKESCVILLLGAPLLLLATVLAIAALLNACLHCLRHAAHNLRALDTLLERRGRLTMVISALQTLLGAALLATLITSSPLSMYAAWQSLLHHLPSSPTLPHLTLLTLGVYLVVRRLLITPVSQTLMVHHPSLKHRMQHRTHALLGLPTLTNLMFTALAACVMPMLLAPLHHALHFAAWPSGLQVLATLGACLILEASLYLVVQAAMATQERPIQLHRDPHHPPARGRVSETIKAAIKRSIIVRADDATLQLYRRIPSYPTARR